MKTFFLFFTLLIFSLSFGQTKKVKTTPKTTVIKEIPLEERINTIKSDPDGDATLSEETEPAYLKEKENENTIYNTAGIEVQPEFPGGREKLFSFFSKNFQFTDEMKEMELQGRIIASFVIERDGSVTNVKIIRSLGFETEREAIRVLKLMPKWLPGEQNGKKVRCSTIVPITIYATKQ